MRCFYLGCWNEPGHYLYASAEMPLTGTYEERHRFEYHGDHIHVDGTLAPKKAREGTRTWFVHKDALVWEGMRLPGEARGQIHYDSYECPQGQYLLHFLNTGFTAIQWWDRTQGDTRGACNSTVMLEGRHTAEEMVAALKEHFPHVYANLEKAGIELVDVTPKAEAMR